MNSMYQSAYCDVSGTPYEQGVQIGAALADTIRFNIDQVREKIRIANVDEKAYRTFVDQNTRFLMDCRREMYEEIEGTAKGAGLPLEELLLLNVPAYFLADKFSKITQECSMVCVRGKATLDGCTYVIKNRDMGIPRLTQALIRRVYPDGRKILEVSGAGTVTFPAVGLNSDGLCVTTTGFWSEKDPTHTERVETADVFLNVRVLLEQCRTAAEAVELCRTAPRMNGLNVIAADRSEAYVLEMTADEMYVEKDEGRGILYRTNHLISERYRHLNTPREKATSSHARYERLTELLKEREGSIRFQDLLRMMSDHQGEPDCLCRHGHEGVPATTVSTTICCIEDEEMWTSIGNPCLALPHAAI